MNLIKYCGGQIALLYLFTIVLILIPLDGPVHTLAKENLTWLFLYHPICSFMTSLSQAQWCSHLCKVPLKYCLITVPIFIFVEILICVFTMIGGVFPIPLLTIFVGAAQYIFINIPLLYYIGTFSITSKAINS